MPSPTVTAVAAGPLRHGRWALPLGGVLIVAAAVVVFRVAPSAAPSSAPDQPVQAGPGSSALDRAVELSAVVPVPTGLAEDFARLQTGLHAKTGLVVRPVGAAILPPLTLGNWSFGPAWSTIKVPLVIAAMRQRHISQPTPAMTAVITESDNAAAESIWESLGDPAAAAADVGAVLHATGDPTTVESRKLRPEYSAFGQTVWPLANQALFLSAAACDPADQPVLTLMARVRTDQKWGLGTLPGTKIKGGWGPSPAGRYLVRQIGILPTPHGLTVVAMAAEPDSGSFADGIDDLNRIAQWLQAHLDALPAGHCGV